MCGFGLLCIHIGVCGLVFKVWTVKTGGEDNGGPGLAGLEKGYMRNNTTAENKTKEETKPPVCQILTWLPVWCLENEKDLGSEGKKINDAPCWEMP